MRSHERRIAATDLESELSADPNRPLPGSNAEEREQIFTEAELAQSGAETNKMGKVVVTAVVENLDDLFAANKGALPADNVRRAEIADALVDTGATGLLLPRKLIAQLGLDPLRIRTAKTITGKTPLQVYRAVRLTVQGRDCISDVAEISDECSAVIGQVPLELMDWVVDPRGQRLIGNPEHGGEHMIEA